MTLNQGHPLCSLPHHWTVEDALLPWQRLCAYLKWLLRGWEVNHTGHVLSYSHFPSRLWRNQWDLNPPQPKRQSRQTAAGRRKRSLKMSCIKNKKSHRGRLCGSAMEHGERSTRVKCIEKTLGLYITIWSWECVYAEPWFPWNSSAPVPVKTQFQWNRVEFSQRSSGIN